MRAGWVGGCEIQDELICNVAERLRFEVSACVPDVVVEPLSTGGECTCD